MVVGIAAFVAVTVVDCIGLSVDGVLSTRESNGLPGVVDPVGCQGDAWCHVVAAHDGDVVWTVVGRAVFFAVADAFDGAIGTRVGVGNPTGELAHILSDEELGTEAAAFTGAYFSID